MRFSKRYFLFTILLFVTEVLIGAFIKDKIIRPYGGDFLVVILVYCFIRTFVNISIIAAATGSLFFAYATEISQYYQLVYKIGLGNSAIAKTVMGTYFAWNDMLAYTLGFLSILLLEKIFTGSGL